MLCFTRAILSGASAKHDLTLILILTLNLNLLLHLNLTVVNANDFALHIDVRGFTVGQP